MPKRYFETAIILWCLYLKDNSYCISAIQTFRISTWLKGTCIDLNQRSPLGWLTVFLNLIFKLSLTTLTKTFRVVYIKIFWITVVFVVKATVFNNISEYMWKSTFDSEICYCIFIGKYFAFSISQSCAEVDL